MQKTLPLFHSDTQYINSSLGVFEKEGFVYYLHHDKPIFCHAKDDLNNYRFIVGNLIYLSS